MLLQVLDGGIYPESGHPDRRLWEAGYLSCLKWEESSGVFCRGGNVSPVRIAASAYRCHQHQAGLSLRVGLETMINFEACLWVCFKQTWQHKHNKCLLPLALGS